MSEIINISSEQEVIVFEDYIYYGHFEPEGDEFTTDEIIHAIMSASTFITLKTLGIDLKSWLEYIGFDNFGIDKFINIKNGIINEQTFLTRNKKKNNDFKSYKLNDVAGLYTEVAKLNPFDIKSVIKFCSTFGIPYGDISFKDIGITLSEIDPLVIQKVDYHALTYKLIEYRLIFDVFINVVTKNINNILNRDKYVVKERGVFYDPTNSDSILNEEKEFLLKLMNSYNLLQTKFSFKPYNDNDFYLQNNYIDLLDYSKYQMMLALMNKSEFKFCKNCDHLFEVTHDKMLFCPPLPFRKRSSCEMAYRNKMRKK